MLECFWARTITTKVWKQKKQRNLNGLIHSIAVFISQFHENNMFSIEMDLYVYIICNMVQVKIIDFWKLEFLLKIFFSSSVNEYL